MDDDLVDDFQRPHIRADRLHARRQSEPAMLIGILCPSARDLSASTPQSVMTPAAITRTATHSRQSPGRQPRPETKCREARRSCGSPRVHFCRHCPSGEISPISSRFFWGRSLLRERPLGRRLQGWTHGRNARPPGMAALRGTTQSLPQKLNAMQQGTLPRTDKAVAHSNCSIGAVPCGHHGDRGRAKVSGRLTELAR